VSNEKVHKAERSPVNGHPAAKSVQDAPSVPDAATEPAQAREPGRGLTTDVAWPRPAPKSANPEVRADLPPLPRPPLGLDKFAGLPRPSVPLPPPSEPKTLGKGEAVKLPPPPIVASRTAPCVESESPPQPTDAGALTQDPPSGIPQPRTTSAPPAPPKSGFMAAVDRSKAQLGRACAALLAPAFARSRALVGKVRSALPARAVEPVSALLDKARAGFRARAERMPGRRPAWLLAVLASVGLLVGVGLLGFVFSVVRHRENTDDDSSGTRTAFSSRPAPSSLLVSNPAATSAPVPALSSCAVAGASHVIAPVAVVAAGVEARTFGDGVALGFAPADHEAVAVRLDLGSLATTGSGSVRSDEPIRRVRPMPAPKDTFGLAVDADASGDLVRGRRTLPLDPPLQAGAVGSDLVWTSLGGPPAGKLWSLDGPEHLDALRGASEGSTGETTTAIAFRRGNAIWVGVARGNKSLAPSGALSHIDGLGTTIGSPAVAIDEGVVLIAWADRASSDEPWRLRIARMKAGGPLGEPASFTPPPGGPGGHVMSPGLAAVPGGRFLLVWTEGPTSRQRVRGITLTLSGQPVGRPLEISNDGINSGQGQVAVTASPGARGVVAFLEATDHGFEVAATPIACGS